MKPGRFILIIVGALSWLVLNWVLFTTGNDLLSRMNSIENYIGVGLILLGILMDAAVAYMTWFYFTQIKREKKDEDD